MSSLTGDWGKIANILNPARLKSSFHQASARVGNYGATEIKKGIVSGAPGGQKLEENSPMTIMMKGSSSPLIDHGDLVGSITYEVLDNGNGVFIGVKYGKEANIAAVHENGYVIAVTPKMRAYMHYQGIHLPCTENFSRFFCYLHVPHQPSLLLPDITWKRVRLSFRQKSLQRATYPFRLRVILLTFRPLKLNTRLYRKPLKKPQGFSSGRIWTGRLLYADTTSSSLR